MDKLPLEMIMKSIELSAPLMLDQDFEALLSGDLKQQIFSVVSLNPLPNLEARLAKRMAKNFAEFADLLGINTKYALKFAIKFPDVAKNIEFKHFLEICRSPACTEAFAKDLVEIAK